MTNLANTDFTLTVDPQKLGRMRMTYATHVFGDGALTYPYGGIPLPAIGRYGIKNAISDFQIIDDDTSGIVWKYDKTNHKLKAYHRAPMVVFEEVVTLTANLTGTTKYPMAWPLYASNGNQALGLMPNGMTPVTTTIAINMHSATPGVRATITAKATDTYSTITISYITQAWQEVFENLVEGETMTAGAVTTNGVKFTAGTPDLIDFEDVGSGYLVGLMIGTKLSSIFACPKPLQKGQTAKAAEYALDWTNAEGGDIPAATTIKPLQTQVWDAAGNIVYFNYIKKPTSGFLYDRFVEEEAITASGQVATHAAGGNVLQPLLWATPGFMPSVTVSGSSATWPIGGTGMTLDSLAAWQPTNFYPKQKLTTPATWTSGTGVLVTLAVKPSYIWGVPEDIDRVVPLEMPDGVRIKSKTIRAMVWGK
jgi:hypothetical protein